MSMSRCDEKGLNKDEVENLVGDINPNSTIQRTRDSLNMIGGIIDFSLKFYNLNNSSTLKAAADESIIVTVTQTGVVKTDTIGIDQIALFPNMRIGKAMVTVQSASFTNVDFTVDVTPEEQNNTAVTGGGVSVSQTSNSTSTSRTDFKDLRRNVAVLMPLLQLTGDKVATVKGILTYEKDLTNLTPEPMVGVNVTASFRIARSLINTRYDDFEDIGNDKYLGNVLDIAYQDVVTQNVSTETGAYELKLPASPFGIDYILKVSDFEETAQTIFLNKLNGASLAVASSKQVVRTIFSTNSTVAVSGIPVVNAVEVLFSVPEGNVDFQPSVDATATAVLEESGVKFIAVLNNGVGYTQVPDVIITHNSSNHAPSVVATATAVVEEGKVVAINITEPGKGYLVSPTIQLVTNTVDASATAVLEYSVGNATSDYISTFDSGSGYTAIPAVTIAAPEVAGGVQATATAVLNGKFTTENIALTNGGAGYTVDTDVEIDYANGTGNGSVATFTANLMDRGTLAEVKVTHTTVYDSTKLPVVTLAQPMLGTGLGADAVLNAEWDNTYLYVMTLDIAAGSEGAGYTPGLLVPYAIIKGFADGSEATVKLVINADGTIKLPIVYNLLAHPFITKPEVIVVDNPQNVGTKKPVITVSKIGKKIKQTLKVVAGGVGYKRPTIAPTYLSLEIREENTSTVFNTLTVASYKVASPIASISVANAGSGFLFNDIIDGNVIPLRITDKSQIGTGTGAIATAKLTFGVSKVKITNKGSGYLAPPTMTIAASTGAANSRAAVNATVIDGKINKIITTNVGDGYTAAPYVELLTGFTPGAGKTPAKITATATAGKLTFAVTTAGIGYTSVPTVNIKTFKTQAVANTILYPNSGKIKALTITKPGEGYTVVPSVKIYALDRNGDPVEQSTKEHGTGAVVTAVLKDGQVDSLKIVNAGTGYYRAPEVEIYVPNSKITAEGYATVDYKTGEVTKVTVTKKGAGYKKQPTVTFTGLNELGTGAEGLALINNAGGVSGVVLKNGGSGYVAQNYAKGADAKHVTVSGTAATGLVPDKNGITPKVLFGKIKLLSFDPYGNINSSSYFKLFTGETVIGDIYMGTGFRTVE